MGQAMMVRTLFKEVPERSAKYLKWIDSLPCIICGGKSTHHHQNRNGHGAKGGTCSDFRALPLCYAHHTLGGTPRHPGSVHGSARLTGWDFWKAYGVDVEAWIVRLNAVWKILQEEGKGNGQGFRLQMHTKGVQPHGNGRSGTKDVDGRLY